MRCKNQDQNTLAFGQSEGSCVQGTSISGDTDLPGITWFLTPPYWSPKLPTNIPNLSFASFCLMVSPLTTFLMAPLNVCLLQRSQ